MPDNNSATIFIAGVEATPLSDSDLVQLSCGSDGCGSNCCKAGAPIVLNPYEIALMCRESRMSYEDLLDIVDTNRAKGFPLVMLPRNPVCHFWDAAGCRIYKARPLACRLFPMGRVFDGKESQYVLPGRNICPGLLPAPSGTVADYLHAQDVELQVRMADRWIEFVNEIEKMPLPDKPVTSVVFHMLVYSPDTPPALSSEHTASHTSPVERFLLRLQTALKQLPRFLARV